MQTIFIKDNLKNEIWQIETPLTGMSLDHAVDNLLGHRRWEIIRATKFCTLTK